MNTNQVTYRDSVAERELQILRPILSEIYTAKIFRLAMIILTKSLDKISRIIYNISGYKNPLYLNESSWYLIDEIL